MNSPPPTIDTQRRTLRQQMRRTRRALSAAQQRAAATNLLRQVRHQLWFLKARHIALYLPNDGEIDPSLLIELCWKMKKRVYLPVLHPIRHNRLWFLPYTRHTAMCKNRFRILEPKLQYHPRRPGWAMDLVMLPLVAFDAAGNRMGMGGGFYDRTFSYKRAEKGIKGARLIGLAHDFQRVGELPVQPWDVPLFGIVTDRAAYLCRR
ncbi:5-formyltetrahydrofolate cyclo-ligase [Marinobacterium lacunae]|uniref:5-formyltetrahydrofolate cyclo-ligase n=1 Tax=Marinobacterium lacunae TaxID=1232683 RepID=A0A081FY55_9GAMM|nr:5-formyltetrahydrofolate cyclo-ligase [Marinobacterium lacunae]KEA63460.1 5-formyltetrahydrofolate cyclo-ligase [Marinobacterium lacunae]